MLESAQFLHILAAEAEHLVTVSIFLPPDGKSQFERRLNDAFASDSFSDTARAWNEERSRVVQEVLEQHLIPAGVKWTRECIREEVEDYLAARCGGHLRAVSILQKFPHSGRA
jgi:transcription elongation factor SPT6